MEYNEENNEEYVSTPDYGRYGKIEFDYIEAGRQIIRLEIVRNEVASTITDAIGAIQELAGLVECECSINVNDLVNDNINANVDAIIERLNYEIKGYQDLAIEIGADIEELNSVIRDYMVKSSFTTIKLIMKMQVMVPRQLQHQDVVQLVQQWYFLLC